jgi:hypothetical protein
VRATDVLRGHAAKEVVVGKECYEEWDRKGRRCVGCNTPVQPGREVGLFMDRYGFGHADCGAMRFAVP